MTSSSSGCDQRMPNSLYVACGMALPTKFCNCGAGWTTLDINSACPAGCMTCYLPAGSSQGCADNPVLLSSGSQSVGQSTMGVSSIGSGSFNFGANFLSGMPGASGGASGGLGQSFQFPQNVRLSKFADGDITLDSGNFTFENFPYDSATDTYSSVGNNTRAELTRQGSGATEEYLLLASDGTVSRFYGFAAEISTPGFLKSFADRYGNTQSMTWANVNGSYQLQTVTDSYGRTTTFSYYGSEAFYQMKEVQDFLGRKTTMQYDTAGRMVAVIGPSITKGAGAPAPGIPAPGIPAPGSSGIPGSSSGGTPGSGTSATSGGGGQNTFPNGTATVYQYDTDNTRPARQNDLIRIWYPNQVAPYITTDPSGQRTVDVAAVYREAMPRYSIEYGQDPTDSDSWGKVVRQTIGDPNPAHGVGGTFEYEYISDPDELPTSIFYDPDNPDSNDQIVGRTTVTDQNDNVVHYDFNPSGMPIRVEIMANRGKITPAPGSPVGPLATSYVTWTRYDDHNMELLVIHPEGNSVEYVYDDGTVEGFSQPYARRIGLLLTETRKPGNDYGIASGGRPGSNGQTQLTRRYFYEPIFNQQCVAIEERGNPIDAGGDYFPPQNLGPTPTNTDRSRYATVSYFDYQKNMLDTIKNDPGLQVQLDMSAEEIETLITSVSNQMVAGGLPAGLELGLGDVNGDGTGDGNEGLPESPMVGNVVMVKHPRVRQIA